MASIHRWLVPRVVFPLYEAVTGRRVWTEVLHLREAQWLTPADLEARAAHKLRPLLLHAFAHVPYYRELFERAGLEPTEVRTIADLARLPVTTKADLRANFPARTIAANLPARRRRPMLTSGSTGMPFAFFADAAATDVWLASFLFFREWAGAPLWDLRIHIAGSPHLYERGGRLQSRGALPPTAESKILRRVLLGERVVRLAAVTLTLDRFLTCIRGIGRDRRYFLFTFPSRAADLAVQLLESNTELPSHPTVIISYAEDLTPTRAAQIQQAFHCPVVNHYSSLEVLHMAQSCPDNPHVLHVNSERAILRIVRQDGSPAKLGERGRLIVTNLANYVMPFINYELGDWAVAGPPCSCGRGFPTLLSLEGREQETIRTPGGKNVSTGSLEEFLVFGWGILPYISEYQVVQTARDALVLRIVPTADFTQAVSKRLATELADWLDPGMSVLVELVERIEPEASGKRLTIKALAVT